jgi:hypothetical protein
MTQPSSGYVPVLSVLTGINPSVQKEQQFGVFIDCSRGTPKTRSVYKGNVVLFLVIVEFSGSEVRKTLSLFPDSVASKLT